MTTTALNVTRTIRYSSIKGIINSAIIHYPSGCFKQGTNVLMADGLIKNIENIEQTDVVACHNSEGMVLRRHEQEYSGELFKINSSLEATPEHPFLAVKKDKISIKGRAMIPNGSLWKRYRNKLDWTPEWIKAKELEKGDFLISPVLKTVEDIEHIDLFNYLEKKEYSHKEFELKNKKQFDEGLIRNKYGRKAIKRYIPVNSDFLRLIGYYLAEGHLSYDLKKYDDGYIPPKHPTGVGFSFNINETEYHEDIVQISQSLFGIKPYVHHRKQRNTTEIMITNVLIGSLLKDLCGEHFDGKRIHPLLMKLPPSKQKHIIEGIWRGDGTTKKASKIINLKNERLLYQVYTILNRLRLYPAIYPSNYAIYYLECCKNHKQFYSNDWLFKRIYKIEKQNYNGKVYNLHVANHNSYVADNFAVHNCEGLVEVFLNIRTRQILPYPAKGSGGTNRGIALDDTIQSFSIDEEVDQNDPIELLVYNHDSVKSHNISVILKILKQQTYTGP